MRRTALLIVLVSAAGLALAAISGAMSSDHSTTRDARILGVAASGAFVAATLDEGKTECFHAEFWNAATNKATHLGKRVACQAPGGIRGPSVIGNRAVWATNVGGNLRDWTVWTATTTSPVPRALATVQGIAADDPDPVVIGRAGAGIVAYAVGPNVTALRANGTTAWKQTATAAVRVIASGDTPGYAGVTGMIAADGSAAILDATGKVIVKGISSGATDECLMKSAAVGMAPGLIVYTRTSPATQFAVPKQAKLLGCAAGIVIYRVGPTIKGIRLSTGKMAALLSGTTVAAISRKGLAWATGSTLHWRPAATAFAPLS